MDNVKLAIKKVHALPIIKTGYAHKHLLYQLKYAMKHQPSVSSVMDMINTTTCIDPIFGLSEYKKMNW